MNQMPTQPNRADSISKAVALNGSPSVEDIMKAFSEIQEIYPDAMASETYVSSYNGGWDSDPEIELELNFHRSIDNPNYEAQMVLWHKAMEEYHKAEHELQMQYNAAYRSNVEQQNAKAEWKKARRAERLANRVTPIGMERCE